MSNPQQPEVRRSEQTSSLSPDSIKGELEAHDRPERGGHTGPVPPGNKALANSGPDQDQPDLDAFATKFGIEENADADPDHADPDRIPGDPKASRGARRPRPSSAADRSRGDVALDTIGAVVTTGYRVISPMVGTARRLITDWRQRSSR